VAFAVDSLVKFRLANGKRNYVRGEWTSLFIVVSQAMALAPALAGLEALRVLRAAPGWRFIAVLARVFSIGGMAAREGRAILRRHAASFALCVAGMTWLTSAVVFTLVE
jgi:hypothetical protein